MKNQAAFIENFLKENEMKFIKVDEKDGVFLCDCTAENGSFRCIISCEDENEYLCIYVQSGIKIPENNRSAVSEFIMRANYGMRIGCFEMDLSDGEFRFRVSLISYETELAETILRRSFFIAIATMDRYCAGLLRVVYGGVAPEDAINDVENQE